MVARPGTVKVYDGPSMLDGARIVVLLTGLRRPSTNTKTGPMLQTWVLRYDVTPHVAQKTGADASVCGDCPLRPLLRASRPDGLRSCYVKTFQGPRSVWQHGRDLPVTPPEAVRALVAGRKVRRGSYGDPAAAPPWVWQALTSTPRDTGYTHQWRGFPALARSVMASVHDAREARRARARGFRTFRILRKNERPGPAEVLCPASKEAGARTTCERCGLCNGSTGPTDRRRSVAIYAH